MRIGHLPNAVHALGIDILIYGITVLAVLPALVAVERFVAWGLACLAPVLPDEFCGPDGWLIDTHGRSGVFDRAAP